MSDEMKHAIVGVTSGYLTMTCRCGEIFENEISIRATSELAKKHVREGNAR